MKQKHTPGPWEWSKHQFNLPPFEGALERECGIYPPSGEAGPVAIVCGEDNAARIVACVNAFEGVEDPEEWMRKAQEDKMRLKLYEFTFGILQEMQDAKNQDETKP